MKSFNGTSNDNFETPDYLYKQLDDKFNFTLDAACTLENRKAPTGFYFDEGKCGLNEKWYGRVFCNPPFSDKQSWIKKAHVEITEGNCDLCVMILPSNTMETAPFHDYIYGNYFYHVMRARVSFIDPETKKPQEHNNSGTVVVYFFKAPETNSKKNVLTYNPNQISFKL